MSNAAIPNPSPPPAWKKWLLAARPFALPASVMPVIFGTVLAVTITDTIIKWLLFLAALVAMAILHTGANLLNDAYDYLQGLDRQVNPASGAVVRGWITPRQAQLAGWTCLSVGSAIGLAIAAVVGPAIFWLGLIGVTVGLLYTWGPFPLKFHAFGDWAVFFNFGILGSLGAWTVQTGYLAWPPALWAVPMSLLVVAILHANNWRDIPGDRNGGIRTIAGFLGDRGSERYYLLLVLGPFAFIIGLILLTHLFDLSPRMPLTFLLTLLTVPAAWRLVRHGQLRFAPEHRHDFLALDGATAQLNLRFGLLCVLALGIDKLLPL